MLSRSARRAQVFGRTTGAADTGYRLKSTWELAQALKRADQIKVERLAAKRDPAHHSAPYAISIREMARIC